MSRILQSDCGLFQFILYSSYFFIIAFIQYLNLTWFWNWLPTGNVQCPEATGSVTGVPEQQDGQEKDQGEYKPSSEQRRCHSVEVSASIDTSGSGEWEETAESRRTRVVVDQLDHRERVVVEQLSNNSHEYFTSGYSKHFLFPNPNSRRNSYSVPRRSHETSARSLSICKKKGSLKSTTKSFLKYRLLLNQGIGLTKGKPYSQLLNSKKTLHNHLLPFCSFFLFFSCFPAPSFL